jgi:hypothetical protein
VVLSPRCDPRGRQAAPGLRRGTVRTRENVPARIAQPPGFAGVRMFGTVRAERTRPAESPANGLANGAAHGAIFAPHRDHRRGLASRSRAAGSCWQLDRLHTQPVGRGPPLFRFCWGKIPAHRSDPSQHAPLLNFRPASELMVIEHLEQMLGVEVIASIGRSQGVENPRQVVLVEIEAVPVIGALPCDRLACSPSMARRSVDRRCAISRSS